MINHGRLNIYFNNYTAGERKECHRDTVIVKEYQINCEKRKECFLDEFIFELGIERWVRTLLIKRKKETILQTQKSM